MQKKTKADEDDDLYEPDDDENVKDKVNIIITTIRLCYNITILHCII